MNLQELENDWRDSQYVNKGLNDRFTALVESDTELNAHREWVQSHIFGFGEKSFHWLHKIVVDQMPSTFKFLEIGGFRMQVVSLYKLLANRTGRTIDRYCVSPMNTTNVGGTPFWESDYFADSKTIHDAHGLTEDYTLFHGYSNDQVVTDKVQEKAQFDVVYIDGGHDGPTVKWDMEHYAPMVKPGGYLICDDCSNGLQMWPGSFPGIVSVSIEVDTYMKSHQEFKHIGAIMHNRIWKRI